MTLIELLIALTVMAVAISALVAGLSSGIVAINRSGAASTAGSIADAKMEGYRRGDFASVPTTSGAVNTTVVVKGRTYGVRVDGSWVCPLGGTPANVSKAGTTTLGSTKIINLSPAITSPADISLGVKVTGAGISSGTVVSAIVSTSTITLSLPATATAAGVALTFVNACTGTIMNRAVKNVVITIRDGAAGRVLVTETSMFDQATG
jgi:type II secretory pathway pseudopilin PulG